MANLQAILAPRESVIATLRLQGASVRDIAQELGIKPASVRTTMHRVYQKCGVANLDDLRTAFVEPMGDDSRASELKADNRNVLAGSAMRQVFEMCFLLCAPVALVHILFMYASPVRFNLNDAGAAGLMILGSFLAMICGFALKRWILARPLWMRVVLSAGLVAYFVACMADVLFTWILLGNPVPAAGTAHVMAYALCFVVPLVVVAIVSTTRFASLDVLRSHPFALCSALVIQFIVAFRVSFDGTITTMAFVVTICACVFLFHFAEPFSESGLRSSKKKYDAGNGVQPTTVRSFYIASIVFGMCLGVALLPSVYGLIEIVACLPFMAIIAFVGYALHRTGTLPASQLLWWSVLMLGVMGIAVRATHSYLLGSLIGVAIVLVMSSCSARIDATLRESAKSWVRTGTLLVCLGALFGVISMQVFPGSPFHTFDLHSIVAWEFLYVGVALVLVLCGAHATWRLCESFLDAAMHESKEGSICPDDMQRMRAFLVLRGMSGFECEVALRTVEGASIREIANALHYSASSVKAARGRAYCMLGVHDVAGLHAALSQVISV